MDKKMRVFTILILSTLAVTVYSSGIYGDINKVPTTGASCRTAKQDRLKVCGVEASRRMAQNDLGRVNKYKNIIVSAARKKKVDAAMVAAFISRESRGGNVLKKGWGDNNNAFGLMQIDRRYHRPLGAWNSEAHIIQGIGIFISFFENIKRKFRGKPIEAILKGAIAAYNTGPGNVRDLNNVDSRTTARDYSNDLVARAKFYKQHGY